MLDGLSLGLTAAFFGHVGWSAWVLGGEGFLKECLRSPLLGGAGEGLREEGAGLPLFTYEVGHFLPGVVLQILGQTLFYVLTSEWQHVPSGEREDWRALLTTVVTLAGSAPLLAPLHKMAYESRWSQLYFRLEEQPLWWAGASLVLASALIETFFWWVHWLAHRSAWFYDNIHSVHHSFVPSTASCASAFHPLDITLLTLGSFAVTMAFPIHHLIHSGYLLFCLFWTLLVHSGFRARLPWLLSRFFNDPNMHCLHHDYGRRGVNLGSLVCVWDHVCVVDHVPPFLLHFFIYSPFQNFKKSVDGNPSN